jgi:hypothetical protein
MSQDRTKKLMKEKLVKKIDLDNNQTLIILDASRMISEDAYVVRMKAKIEIPVEKDLFSEIELKEILFGDILDKIGKVTVYEHLSERNFIMAEDKDELFEKLLHDFFDTLLQYISMPDFPKKLILKQYKDKVDKNKHTIKAI